MATVSLVGAVSVPTCVAICCGSKYGIDSVLVFRFRVTLVDGPLTATDLTVPGGSQTFDGGTGNGMAVGIWVEAQEPPVQSALLMLLARTQRPRFWPATLLRAATSLC